MAWYVGTTLAILVAAIIALRLLTPLPELEPRRASTAITDTADTALGQAIAPLASEHPGLTGIHMLADGLEAFAARALLAQAAESSLDIQYYIWRDDLSGIMLLQEIKDAADRGVRVRMLLDDNGLGDFDLVLAALNTHENIEIRLFNPFVLRSPKWLGYASDFSRLNRRMHNKSLTADGQATIIGGRNIGDEYFAAQTGGLFYDLDVLAIGQAVSDVSADFDRYWASKSSYPVDRILPAASKREQASLIRKSKAEANDPAAIAYANAVENSQFTANVLAGELAFVWAPTRLVSDDPAKGLGLADDDDMLIEKLSDVMGTPESEVGIIAGYFVPTDAGVEAFTQLAKSGVDVSILTNSYAATDVAYVHAGYAPHRERLLSSGISLYELRPSDGTASRKTKTGSGSIARSSGSTLHAKTFTVDRQRLFIGSFNFDPRSFDLNTEMGFVIESPELTAAVQDSVLSEIPERAWTLSQNEAGEIAWSQGEDKRAVEPDTTFSSRLAIRVISWLPVEWLL